MLLPVVNSKAPRNPRYIPPEGRCALDIIPPEIIAYIFETGTRMVEGDDAEDILEEDDGDEEFVDVDSDDEDDITEDEIKYLPAGVSGVKVEGDANACVDGNRELKLPFQVRMSHVCRHWRQIAINTPSLWTRLTFDDPTNDFEMSAEWIRRSKALPLDIEIDVSLPDDALFDPDNDDQPDKALSERALSDIKRAQELLAPEIARWRSFELGVSIYDHMVLALEAMAKCPAAPMLEILHLYCHGENEDADFEHFRPPHLRKHYTLFGGLMPKLRDIVFWGVHVEWSMFIPPSELDVQSLGVTPVSTTNLTEIEFGYHTEDVRPTFKTFMNILRCAPRLTRLAISCSGPLKPSNTSIETIALPTLRSLRLAFLDLQHAMNLALTLYVPNLSEIELEFEGNDYTPLMGVLRQPMKPPFSTLTPLSLSSWSSPNSFPTSSTESPDSLSRNTANDHSPSMLTNITEAKLSGMPCDDRLGAMMFYDSCPRLRRLHLNMHFLPLPFFTVLMDHKMTVIPNVQMEGDPTESGSAAHHANPQANKTANAATDSAIVTETSNEKRSWTVITDRKRLAAAPLLESLTISGVTGEDLKTFIEKRHSLGYKLKELKIDEDDSFSRVDPEDFKWLQHRVENVEWVEISDDEGEDAESEEDIEEDDEEDGEEEGEESSEESSEESVEDEEEINGEIEDELSQQLTFENNWAADDVLSYLAVHDNPMENNASRSESRETDDSEWETEPEDSNLDVLAP